MTAVEWLEVKLDNIGLNSDIIGDYIQQAKEMEKQQIERMYSEEEVLKIITKTWTECVDNYGNNFKKLKYKIFEQFKKK